MGNLKKNRRIHWQTTSAFWPREVDIETLEGFELDLTVLIQIKRTENTQFIIPEITLSDMDDLWAALLYPTSKIFSNN